MSQAGKFTRKWERYTILITFRIWDIFLFASSKSTVMDSELAEEDFYPIQCTTLNCRLIHLENSLRDPIYPHNFCNPWSTGFKMAGTGPQPTGRLNTKFYGRASAEKFNMLSAPLWHGRRTELCDIFAFVARIFWFVRVQKWNGYRPFSGISFVGMEWVLWGLRKNINPQQTELCNISVFGQFSI
jgi:hypothetical protein